MYCNNCGNKVDINQKYCNKCGNFLSYNISSTNKKIQFKKRNSLIISIVIVIIVIVIILRLFDGIINLVKGQDYYFPTEGNTNETQQGNVEPVENKKGKYKTAIITDNVYSGISVNSIQDAKKLIVEDSVNQKQSDYPKEIIDAENSIINKYGITAVNLREMDKEYVEELEKVVGRIYSDFPSARGYLTNLTLTNIDMRQAGIIALFMPSFIFGTSDTDTSRPWVIKSQIQLNAKFFLNPEKIDISVETSSKSGHFPPNATRYSPLAHEFGHYLSFIALLNNYYTNSLIIIEDNKLQNYYDIMHDFSKGTFSKKMLDEAYQNYLKDNSYIDFDKWRGNISNYALSKDEQGDYIYDETIAEAFHDTYLNGNNANKVSKYIVDVLKKYLEQ